MSEKVYTDESILKKRKELDRERGIEPEDSVYLAGELTSFERHEIM